MTEKKEILNISELLNEYKTCNFTKKIYENTNKIISLSDKHNNLVKDLIDKEICSINNNNKSIYLSLNEHKKIKCSVVGNLFFDNKKIESIHIKSFFLTLKHINKTFFRTLMYLEKRYSECINNNTIKNLKYKKTNRNIVFLPTFIGFNSLYPKINIKQCDILIKIDDNKYLLDSKK